MTNEFHINSDMQILSEAEYNSRLLSVGFSPTIQEVLSPAQAAFLASTKKYVWFCAGRGCGKCFKRGTKLILFNGSIKNVEDLAVGDVLMGWDNTPRPILSLARGEDEMYEVIPAKGESHTVNSEHILTLKYRNESQGKDEIYDIPLKDYLKIKDSEKGKLSYLFRVPLEFPEKPTDLDPYIAGSFFIRKEKRIPFEYLVNSRNNRLQLLAGIIDSDGSMYENQYKISTKHDELKDDILYLSRSLGLAAYANQTSICCEITISGETDMVPVKVDSKKCYPSKQVENALHTEFEIKPVGRDDYYGFTVEGDGRVVLADFTVTHNTHVGARYVYRKVISQPKVKGLICANTYDQLHSATLPPLFDYLNKMGIDFVVDKRPPESWGLQQTRTNFRNVMTLRNGKTIFLRSLDQPEYIRGIEVGWIWIDEISSTTKDAFDIVIGCLRDTNTEDHEVRVTGTPDGDNWTWREFSKKYLPDDKTVDDGTGNPVQINSFYDIFFMSTRDNPFLTRGFVLGLLAAFDPRKAAQEIDGRVLMDQDSAIYYGYNSEYHERLLKRYDPSKPLYLCMDFNASSDAPMCAVVAQQHSYKDGTPFVQVLHEFVIHNGNTPKICDAFTRTFIGHAGGVRVYGDSQGHYRAATVGINDYKMIEERLKINFNHVSFHVPDKQANEVNRIAAVNAMFLNANGDVRTFINPACEELIKDFKELRPDSHGKINKKDPNRSHLSDALSYYLSVDFPVGVTQIDFDLPYNMGSNY